MCDLCISIGDVSPSLCALVETVGLAWLGFFSWPCLFSSLPSLCFDPLHLFNTRGSVETINTMHTHTSTHIHLHHAYVWCEWFDRFDGQLVELSPTSIAHSTLHRTVPYRIASHPIPSHPITSYHPNISHFNSRTFTRSKSIDGASSGLYSDGGIRYRRVSFGPALAHDSIGALPTAALNLTTSTLTIPISAHSIVSNKLCFIRLSFSLSLSLLSR